MARDLELDGALHVAEGVEVLQLGLDAERRLPDGTHRDVRVAAQAALLHVPVVDADRDEDLAHAAEGLGGVRRRSQVGLGDDLDERHAAAVEVEVRGAARSPAKPSCSDLPASSSMCTRVMPTVTARPSAAKAIDPRVASGRSYCEI